MMNHPLQQPLPARPGSLRAAPARPSLKLVQPPRLVQLYQEGDDLYVEMNDGSRWQLIQSPGTRTPWEVAGIQPVPSVSG